ncbi:hypothetical protein FQN50_005206 [Emmonsiellopsis sp. PD_5]|nr:hypothetical protein FQN50_005206 [Emmonsiellopsis sp. PD_5]
MESSKTITELKTSFARDQIRLLSTALTPSENWRDYGPAFENDIPEKAVEEVLMKLNAHLRKHNRAAFSSQAIHHVARQIETLYWNAIDPEVGGEGAGGGLVVERGTDLTSSRTISRLPEEWRGDHDDADDDDVNEDEKMRYTTLHHRLTTLSAQRAHHQARLAQYKQLQELLQPFREPQTTIQPNLVTRDGELGQELDRMRMLVAKVTGRVRGGSGRVEGGFEEGGGHGEEDGEEEDVDVDVDARLAKVLEVT